MYVWQHDYDTCRDLAYDHIEKVIERYQAKVTMWNIASGLNVNHNFQFTAQQMLDQLVDLGYIERDESVEVAVLDRARNLGQVYAATGRPAKAIEQ